MKRKKSSATVDDIGEYWEKAWTEDDRQYNHYYDERSLYDERSRGRKKLNLKKSGGKKKPDGKK